MTVITIVQLESAINRARDQHPSINCVLNWSVKVLAEIYGQMIGQKTLTLELDELPKAPGLHLVGQVLARVELATRDGDVGPRPCEREHHLTTEAAAPTRDERDRRHSTFTVSRSSTV